jgi:ATP-dependent RNA helicase DHX29
MSYLIDHEIERKIRTLLNQNPKQTYPSRPHSQSQPSLDRPMITQTRIKKLCLKLESIGFVKTDIKKCLEFLCSNNSEIDFEGSSDYLAINCEHLPRSFRANKLGNLFVDDRACIDGRSQTITVEKPTNVEKIEDNEVLISVEEEKKMNERREGEAKSERERMKKREEERKIRKEIEEQEFLRAQKLMLSRMEMECDDDEDESDSDSDSDSLENYGLSEDEIKRKNAHKENVKAFTKDRKEFVHSLAEKLKDAKRVALEEKRRAGKKMNKQRAKDLAENVRKVLTIAETFKISEKELELPDHDDVEKLNEVTDDLGDTNNLTRFKKERLLEEEKEKTERSKEKVEEKKNNEKEDDSEEGDDDFQILYVFGDEEPEALKLTAEDLAIANKKKIEATIIVTSVLYDSSTVGAAIINSNNNSNNKKKSGANVATVALMTPKTLLAKFCEKEKWLAARYDKIKTDDKKIIRYSATVERSNGPKYLRKPTIMTQTTAEFEPEEGGFKNVSDAQDAAAAMALFRVLYFERDLKTVIPSELNHYWRDYYRQYLLLKELFSTEEDNDNDISAKEKFKEDDEDWDTFAARAQKMLVVASRKTQIELSTSSNKIIISDTALKQQSSSRESSKASDDSFEKNQTQSEHILRTFEDKKQTPAWKAIEMKRNELPIAKLRGDLLTALKNYDIVVCCGETGCGKTTQVPQYVLDNEIENLRGAAANIICTQPRRVAATSVAERVSFERCEKDGVGGRTSDVGYQVRGDNKTNRGSTKLTFCTVGILLRRLQSDRYLKGVTHVLLDEVHERSLDSDFALALLRDVPAHRRRLNQPLLKLVLMSATIDSKLFSTYLDDAPVVTAPGRTFPVQTIFLEQIYESLEYVLDHDNKACRRPRGFGEEAKSAIRAGGGGNDRRRNAQLIDSWGEDAENMFGGEEMPENPDYDFEDDHLKNASKKTRLSLSRLDEHAIDYDLIEQLIAYLDETEERAGINNGGGAFLVFLPGKGEVDRLVDRLKGSKRFRDAIVLPLHSNVSNRDQKMCFTVNFDSRARKIVVATNVAETSVTIPDITCVIDSGRVKERRWDPKRGLASLGECFISRASAKQRRGRAGRVREGKCFSLYTSKRHDVLMKAHQEPEMKRAPLTEIVLQIASLGEGGSDSVDVGGFDTDPRSVLNRAPEPPAEESIARAVDTLINIGALEQNYVKGKRGKNDHTNDDGEEEEKEEEEDKGLEENEEVALVITPLGKRLAMLPLDAALAKMLLFAVLLRCLAPALTIAAVVSHKDFWLASESDTTTSASSVFKKNLIKIDKENDSVAKGQISDQLVHAAAYEKWNEFAHDITAQKKWARENGCDHEVLKQIRDLRVQFFDALKAGKLLASKGKKEDIDNMCKPWNSDAKKATFIKAALCAGLYPNLSFADATEIANNQSSKRASTAADKKTIFEWKDSRNADVFPHPSSLVSKIERKPGTKLPPRQFAIYAEKVKTSRTFLRECTLVSDIEVLLFCGRKFVVEHEQKRVIVDDWLKIPNVDSVHATLLKKLRSLFDNELLMSARRSFDDNDDDDGFSSSPESSDCFNVIRACLLKIVANGARL